MNDVLELSIVGKDRGGKQQMQAKSELAVIAYVPATSRQSSVVFVKRSARVIIIRFASCG